MVLSGWKSISKYLNVGIRTAQRWAKSNGLPVHRAARDSKHGLVTAFPSDLDAWIRRHQAPEAISRNALLTQHVQLIDALKKNLDEQKRLIKTLRAQMKKTNLS